MKFRKKPVVIDAIQWTGENEDEVFEWARIMSPGDEPPMEVDLDHLIIGTLEGDHRARPMDWIICGVNQEFYPCKPDIFDKTYDPAESSHQGRVANMYWFWLLPEGFECPIEIKRKAISPAGTFPKEGK